jgi:hypothetical protein
MDRADLNYRVVPVPANWAWQRDTHPAVATAIWAVSYPSRHADDIWEKPSEEEERHIRMAVSQYVRAGVFGRNPTDRYAWGCGHIEVRGEDVIFYFTDRYGRIVDAEKADGRLIREYFDCDLESATVDEIKRAYKGRDNEGIGVEWYVEVRP